MTLRAIRWACMLANGRVGGNCRVGSIRFVFSLSSRLDEELMPGLMNSARREITRARVLRAFSQDSKSNVPFSFAHPPALTTLPSQTHLPLRVRSSAPFRIFLADSSLRRSTVVLPPIACNTQIDCRHPCIRASECGHPLMRLALPEADRSELRLWSSQTNCEVRHFSVEARGESRSQCTFFLLNSL